MAESRIDVLIKEPIAVISPDIILASTFPPDGRWLSYSIDDYRNFDIMLVENFH